MVDLRLQTFFVNVETDNVLKLQSKLAQELSRSTRVKCLGSSSNKLHRKANPTATTTKLFARCTVKEACVKSQTTGPSTVLSKNYDRFLI